MRDGILFFSRFRFTLSYRRGSKNLEPDALLYQEEEVVDRGSGSIIPRSMALGTTQWALERKVRDDSAVLAGFLVGCLFVPSSLRPQVLKWGHSSRLACHPGVSRTAFLVAQRFCLFKPSMCQHEGSTSFASRSLISSLVPRSNGLHYQSYQLQKVNQSS